MSQQYASWIHELSENCKEPGFSLLVNDLGVTLELPATALLTTSLFLRDDQRMQFKQLIDVCGVDYLNYGTSEWQTDQATAEGFSRGTQLQQPEQVKKWDKPRYAVVYHLLSLTFNRRIRLKVYLAEEPLVIPTVCELWPAANWFEREAFDLYGIWFEGHPDLRRLLTDYGFVGHPFRKDFPLSGNVEVRYDATEERVIYEPVDIEPRILVPKVIRADEMNPAQGVAADD